MFLFEQFRRYANIFFLVVALLQVRECQWFVSRLLSLNEYRPTGVENLAGAGAGVAKIEMPGPGPRPGPGLTLVFNFLINVSI